MATVGGRIRTARLAKGLRQEDVAAKVGVSKGAVAQWEGNTIKGLAATNLLKLADTLEVSVRWLLEYKDQDGNPVPMGRPTHLDPDQADLLETFKLLEPRFQEELMDEAHKYLRLSASQQPSRANPYPGGPKDHKRKKPVR